jgi:CO/xanthine dehydrogenase Mo-binding subunit
VSALSRRHFLRRTGWVAVGTTVFVTTGCGGLPALPTRNDSVGSEILGWLQLTPEGRFRLFDPRAEIGQDAGTGLLQIAADGLGVSPAMVDLVRPDTDAIAPVRSTVGSESIALFAPLVARAGAALEATLRSRAAERLSAEGSTLRATDQGYVVPGGALVTFAALAGDGEAIRARAIPDAATLQRGPSVGAPVQSKDLDAILHARPLYAGDLRLPGMVHARVLRPPRRDARPVAMDDSAARALPGCLGTVEDGDLVCVLGERSGVLAAAVANTRVTWEGGAALDVDAMRRDLDIDRRLAAGDLEHGVVSGRVEEDVPWPVDLRLSIPFAAHAFLEPRVAVARWQDGRLDVWTGTQDAFLVRSALAKAFDLAAQDVSVRPQRTGGAFGGRTLCTVELEAARIARRVGRPVRLQWTREDEFTLGFHRPPSEHRLRARLDASGRISDWWHAFTSGHVLFTSAAMPGWMQTATSLVPDPGVARGAAPPYAADRTRVEFQDVRLPVPTGPWRGLGAAPNGCAVELLVDALARAAGRDPLRFRLDQLPPEHDRLRHCLARLGALTEAGARTGHAIGHGCAIYKEQSFVAVAAEVTREAGRPRVTRLWCVHDCGLVVNPDRVRAQIEGNLTWGIGTVLSEALAFDADGPSAQQFDRYAIPRFSDVPPLTVELVESQAPPSGAAETAIAAAPAAILNAFAALDGAAPRTLPIT